MEGKVGSRGADPKPVAIQGRKALGVARQKPGQKSAVKAKGAGRLELGKIRECCGFPPAHRSARPAEAAVLCVE